MSIKTVILQFICPDKPGLVSDLASWIASKNGNIRHADHHTDADAKLFLSRIEWDLDGFLLDKNLEIFLWCALENFASTKKNFLERT